MPTPIPNDNATSLGGPIEAQVRPGAFFSPETLAYPTFQNTPAPVPMLNSSTTLTPGAGGAAPTFATTSSGSVTDPTTGITATVSGLGARSNFVPNNVELAVPVFSADGAQINVLGGARSSGFTTGVGLSLSEGDVKLGATYRRLTPPDLQGEGTDLYGASLGVGGDLRFTASLTVQDAPGQRTDSTTFSAGLTAPLGNGWTGTASGRAVLRPGDNNDTVGGGLQFGNGDVNAGLDLSQTGGATVGTVRFGINF